MSKFIKNEINMLYKNNNNTINKKVYPKTVCNINVKIILLKKYIDS